MSLTPEEKAAKEAEKRAAKEAKEAEKAAKAAEKEAEKAAKEAAGLDVTDTGSEEDESEEPESRGSGRFEVKLVKKVYVVFNPQGQKVAKFDNDSKAAEFALRSNQMVGIKS